MDWLHWERGDKYNGNTGTNKSTALLILGQDINILVTLGQGRQRDWLLAELRQLYWLHWDREDV